MWGGASSQRLRHGGVQSLQRSGRGVAATAMATTTTATGAATGAATAAAAAASTFAPAPAATAATSAAGGFAAQFGSTGAVAGTGAGALEARVTAGSELGMTFEDFMVWVEGSGNEGDGVGGLADALAQLSC